MTKSKVTTGANDRPKDETIAQTGDGLPDDSSKPVEVDEAEVEKAREQLKRQVRNDIERPQKGSA